MVASIADKAVDSAKAPLLVVGAWVFVPLVSCGVGIVSFAVVGTAEGAAVVSSGAEVVSSGADVVSTGCVVVSGVAVGGGDPMIGIIDIAGPIIGIIELAIEGKSTVVGAKGAKDPQSLLHWRRDARQAAYALPTLAHSAQHVTAGQTVLSKESHPPFVVLVSSVSHDVPHAITLLIKQLYHPDTACSQIPFSSTEGRFGGRDSSGGKVNDASGGSDKTAGLKVAAGEGATGATSPQSTALQEFAVATHSTSAFPTVWHDEQQVIVGQDAWRSSHGDPVLTWSESELHVAAQEKKFEMMQSVKAAVSLAQLASTNGGKVMPRPPSDGETMDGVVTDGEDWPSASACDMRCAS
jgi:hypothetical protein